MTINDDGRSDAAGSSSAEVRGPQRPNSVRTLKPLHLENRHPRGRAARDSGGSDPYNTSGSFDRTKNWERIGKR